MPVLHRTWRLAGALVVTLAACGPSPEPRTPVAATACDGPKLRTCERDLAHALSEGKVPAPLVASYMKSRESQNPGDPWAKLWTALSARGDAHVAVIDARPDLPAPPVTAKLVKTTKLPEPTDLSGATLVAAMAEAAGYDHVVWLGAGPDGTAAYEAFPHDPIAPLMLGLAAVAYQPGAAPHLPKNLEIAASIRRAFEAAGSFRYLDVAKEDRKSVV